MNELQTIIDNWETYCIDENFIGKGLTRKVYRVGEYVLKKPINNLGYKCSLAENEIYNKAVEHEENLEDFLTTIYYVDENIQISQYVEPLNKNGEDFYISDINNPTEYGFVLQDDFFDLIDDFHLLGVQIDELGHSRNLGLTKDKEIICFDYGLTYELATELAKEIEKGNIKYQNKQY